MNARMPSKGLDVQLANDGVTWVGLDVHKNQINVAVLLPDGSHREWQLGHDERTLRRLGRKLVRMAPGEVRACYEAGACGFTPKRLLEKAAPELVVEVIAPSNIPSRSGKRVKNDRIDARTLAEYLRGDLLTEVLEPTPHDETVRDLCRCRVSAVKDRQRNRNRVLHFLLRRGQVFREGRAWTRKHWQWLRSLSFQDEVETTTFGSYLLAVEQSEERVAALEQSIEQTAQEDAYREPVGRLRCFLGIDTVSAMVLVSELYSFERFRKAKNLMGFVGLGISESTSIASRRGGITKTGNAHVRHVLAEAALHYVKPPRVSRVLRRRREGQDPRVVTIADRARHRLHRRYWHLVHRGVPSQKALTAVARELLGFIWAALQPLEAEGAAAGR